MIRQLMMAGPLMILYEIGIIGARIFGKKSEQDMDEPIDEKENTPEETEK